MSHQDNLTPGDCAAQERATGIASLSVFITIMRTTIKTECRLCTYALNKDTDNIFHSSFQIKRAGYPSLGQ